MWHSVGMHAGIAVWFGACESFLLIWASIFPFPAEFVLWSPQHCVHFKGFKPWVSNPCIYSPQGERGRPAETGPAGGQRIGAQSQKQTTGDHQQIGVLGNHPSLTKHSPTGHSGTSPQMTLHQRLPFLIRLVSESSPIWSLRDKGFKLCTGMGFYASLI